MKSTEKWAPVDIKESGSIELSEQDMIDAYLRPDQVILSKLKSAGAPIAGLFYLKFMPGYTFKKDTNHNSFSTTFSWEPNHG